MDKFSKGLETWDALSSKGLFGALFTSLKKVFDLVKHFVELYKAVK
ncbi:hypothetical protein [Corynebacterium sp. HS2168-gen11]|nr:hypothetical protein [Corynebacterium sp. HS2168-gen11]MCS4536129.1 hypothetical protein [Corynebacterium sp. HS2168-gen11]